MTSQTRSRMFVGVIIILLCILPAVSAASVPEYSTRYTITLREDGTALWNVEYRTPLTTDEDLDSFSEYARDLNTIYLPELRDLMQHSAAQAALGTSRQMEVNNFTGNAVVQTSPTGKFGLVTYTFAWTNFARSDGGLSAGDAFVGGMYLAKDNTLIIRYPGGYTVASAEPAPDQTNNGLIWHGLRAFGPGQPQVSLTKPAFPLFIIVFLPVIGIIAIAACVIYRRRSKLPGPDDSDEPEESSVAVLSDADLFSLEEKITNLLAANGGEHYQSGIVKALGLPKSTVSSALKSLHEKGIIQKVRKGRENLIRLVQDNKD
ncbi:helix-turn-helix transcriptional regulator [Methanoregula sp.]|uniref:helix-turn-helix transcriptional regulator n=1 Tax=Methanoregula sp. TaxID=2052170 RepID=UPI003568B4CA